MKIITVCTVALLLVLAFPVFAETPVRAGRPAFTGGLILGENEGDKIAQLGLGVEYALIPHLSAGMGYVYLDGIDPLQEHALSLSIKGYLFDRSMDLYADAGAQVYLNDGIDAVLTFKAGAEWQSSFGLFCALEGGAESEGSNWGYLYGLKIGYRI